jgi:hypothetical protein
MLSSTTQKHYAMINYLFNSNILIKQYYSSADFMKGLRRQAEAITSVFGYFILFGSLVK